MLVVNAPISTRYDGGGFAANYGRIYLSGTVSREDERETS